MRSLIDSGRRTFFRALLPIMLFVAGVPAHAALIDGGSYTTDTSSGLDWLDVTATTGMTANTALAANSDWRLATNAEVEALFAVAFAGYYANSNAGLDVSTSHWQKAGPEYAGHTADAAAWQSLFGTVTPGYVTYSYGLYRDETATWRLLGSLHSNQDPYNDGPWDVIFGPDYETDATADATTTGDNKSGIFLVRSTTIVPVPAAVWLFGSALAGLGWRGRRRMS